MKYRWTIFRAGKKWGEGGEDLSVTQIFRYMMLFAYGWNSERFFWTYCAIYSTSFYCRDACINSGSTLSKTPELKINDNFLACVVENKWRLPVNLVPRVRSLAGLLVKGGPWERGWAASPQKYELTKWAGPRKSADKRDKAGFNPSLNGLLCYSGIYLGHGEVARLRTPMECEATSGRGIEVIQLDQFLGSGCEWRLYRWMINTLLDSLTHHQKCAHALECWTD